MRERRLKEGKMIYDLTVSNPTECGIGYPTNELLAALSQPESLRYRADPRGILTAREAVAGYYAQKSITIDPSDILLTASTSEAYSMLFSLLFEPGDAVLVPVPSYPLFEFLARLSNVALCSYHLHYIDQEWRIDLESVKEAITGRTKAMVIVSPHNPTGAFLKKAELVVLQEIAAAHGLALIVDEVFSEYACGASQQRVHSAAGSSDVLTFVLNGISKLAGLPQIKLGWIVVSGTPADRREALERLEVIADTFLSVNTPVQVGLPNLLRCGQAIRSQIQQRIAETRAVLENCVDGVSACSLLTSEGGWYAVLRLPRTRTDEEWALELLDNTAVYTFPGYFFEFEQDGHLVLSLLPETTLFAEAIRRMVEYMRSCENTLQISKVHTWSKR